MKTKKILLISLLFLMLGLILSSTYYFLYFKKIKIFDLTSIQLMGKRSDQVRDIEIFGTTPLNKKVILKNKNGYGNFYGGYVSIEIAIPDTNISEVSSLHIIISKTKYICPLSELEPSSSSNGITSFKLPSKIKSKDNFLKKLITAFPFNTILLQIKSIKDFIITADRYVVKYGILSFPYTVGFCIVLYFIVLLWFLLKSILQYIHKLYATNFASLRPAKQSFYSFYLPVVLFLIALIWKLSYSNIPYIWYDEAGMIFNALHDTNYILTLPTEGEPNPPFFMLLFHYWVKIFGTEPGIARIIPIICNAITAVILYHTGKRFFNPGVGVLSSAFFILSQSHFFFGLCARPYSMMSMATAASLYSLLFVLKNPDNKKGMILLVLSDFLLLYIHYYTLFLILVQLITSLIYFNNKKIFRTILTSLVIVTFSFLPFILIILKQMFLHVEDTWRQRFLNTDIFDYILHPISFFNNIYVPVLIIIVIIIGCIKLFVIKKKGNIFSTDLLIIFLWWFIPYTIMFLISSKICTWFPSYLLFNSIGIYLFFSLVITLLWQKKQFRVICCALLLIMFLTLDIKSINYSFSKVQNSINNIKKTINNNSFVLISKYSDVIFMYYYDRNIYKDIDHYDSLLVKNKIYVAQTTNEAKHRLQKMHFDHFVYVSTNPWEDDTTNFYLESMYKRTDSLHYRYCFGIKVFETIKAGDKGD